MLFYVTLADCGYAVLDLSWMWMCCSMWP